MNHSLQVGAVTGAWGVEAAGEKRGGLLAVELSQEDLGAAQ
jgi:hypothetical protein